MNPLKQVALLGQSIWLDFISRHVLDSGELHRLVEEDGLGGVTSNPSIFEKSIREGSEYAAALNDMRRRRPGAKAFELYEALVIKDIQHACDVMRPVYDRTKSRDGYVSLEVTLHRGETPEEIVREAVHLWETVGRPNVMIKVPGTADGRKAFEELIAAGINVNVTLLFARSAYAETHEAYIRGLERRVAAGGDVARIASVASFFVSRIDTAVDKLLDARLLDPKLAAARTPKDTAAIEKLQGRAAIANAKLAYAHYENVISGKRWRDLARRGAQTQRVLWASTGTKNKKYSDVMYIEELIGRDTVNTAPPATIDAFRDHGKPRASLTEGLPEAKKVLRDLEALGISFDGVTDALLVDGLKQFSDAFVTLLRSIDMPAPGAPASPSGPGAPVSAMVVSTGALASAPASGAPAAGATAAASSSSLASSLAGAASSASSSPASGAVASAVAIPRPSAPASAPASAAAPATRAASAAPATKAPPAVRAAFEQALADWKSSDRSRRFTRKDATVWTGGDEGRWLGWLDAPARAKSAAADLRAFADEVRRDGIQHVLLLGMGGSSLGPAVLARTFGSRAGFPELLVLDSTDPEQITAFERRVDPARTLFVVASKSGSTLEPNILEAYFWERAQSKLGAKTGRQFVAITDPGSKLEAVARSKGYRRVFHGDPSIGGRFSALSAFGLVPAALIGVDLDAFAARAQDLAGRCIGTNDPATDPGVRLGAFLGACARAGRDKLTLVVSPRLESLGAWLEQLVAESTGKKGLGIVPVDREPLGPPSVYGDDRVFAYVRLSSEPDGAQDAGVDALERAGQAVVRIAVADALELGAEFYRWEIATAVAGSVLGIHPFDQPDVEAAKVATRALTEAYEAAGSLPEEKPFFEEQGVLLFAPRPYALELYGATGPHASLADVLCAHFALQPGGYAALLAFVPMDAGTTNELQSMRTALRNALRAATCVGFGPRYLHSTGQAYKGGPPDGVFLQITRAVPVDVPVPGHRFAFGVVEAAQARGDLQVLVERGRRALRAHITGDLRAGLASLRRALPAAGPDPAPSRS